MPSNTENPLNNFTIQNPPTDSSVNVDEMKKMLLADPDLAETLAESVGIPPELLSLYRRHPRSVGEATDHILSRIPGVSPNMVRAYKRARETNPFFIWIYKTLYYTAIVALVVLINCNILFIIQNATKRDIIDKWFPSDIKTLPYGTDDNYPHHDPEKNNNLPALSRFGNWITRNAIAPGSDPLPVGGKLPEGGELGFPYNKYHHADDQIKGSSMHGLANFFIIAMAETSTKANEFNKQIFSALNIEKDHPDGVKYANTFLFCFGILLLLLVPLNLVYTTCSLFVNQFSELFQIKNGSVIFLLLLFLLVGAIVWVGIYSIYNTVIFAFKLMFYPLLKGHRADLIEIFNTHKKLVKHIVGLAAIIALWQSPFNQEYKLFVKLVPTLLHAYIVIIGLVEFFNGPKAVVPGVVAVPVAVTNHLIT